MFENPRRGRQARNFTTNVPKILDLKSSSEQIISGGVGGSNEITFYGGGMDIFWNSTMLLFVSCSIQSQDKRDN